MLEGLIALFFSNFIGGALSPLFVKLGIHEFPVLTFSALRFLIATLVFLPFFLRNKRGFDKKHRKILIFYSVFFAGNAILYSVGLQFTTALVSQVLYTTVPIFTGFFSYLIIKEKFGANKIIGAVLAMSGIGFLIYQSLQNTDNTSFGSFQGNFIILIAILSWSLYLVLSKKLTSLYSPTVTSFTSYALTFAIAAIFMPFEWIVRPFTYQTVTMTGVWSLFGVGIISSALSFFLIQYGVKKTTPFTASLFFYLAPLFSALTAIPFLHEKVTPQLVIGGILIITGVFLATTYEYLKNKR